MNSVSSKLSTIIRAFWFLIVILSWNSAFANSYSKYVGESFYLPVPSLSVSNAAIYNYQWEPTLHVNIKNNSLGEAEISSYFSGSEIVTCRIYYYIQSPSGSRKYGTTTQSHSVSCKNNNLTISASKTIISPGEGVQLSTSFDNRYYSSSAQISYSASPSGVVSVSPSGYVTGVSAGTANITAKSNLSNNVSSVTITVRKIDPEQVEITPSPASVYCDSRLTMNAKVYPTGSPQNISWSLYKGSSSIASISSSGVVSAFSPGEITVKATAENGVYALRTVSVIEPSFTQTSSIPSNNATEQSVFSNPSVTFSHALYKGETFDGIALTTSSGSVNGTAEIGSRSVIFKPQKPLAANTKYTLSIPANAVKNKWGTPYSSKINLVFSTGNLEKLSLKSSLSNKFVKEGTTIQLTTNKSNAAIYYTTDNSTPTEKSKRYTGAITIQKDTELRAIAMLEGYENSDELHKTYIISNVAVVKTFPNDANPLYVYKDVMPSVTFSNKIEASSNVDKIVMQCMGVGEVEKQVIVSDSSIYIIPTKGLELGNVYKVNIPSNAIVTWQGEYNEAAEFTFSTGDFVKFLNSSGPEMAQAIKTNNSLYVWGSQYSKGSNSDGSYEYNIAPSPTLKMSNVQYASSGFTHHALIKNDGSLWMWGRQYCGEFGNGTTTASSTPVKILSSGVREVSTGGQTTAIIKQDNTLWMCGRNDFGQIGNGKTNMVKTFTQVLSNVKSAVAGWGVSFAVTDDNNLYAWGRNGNGELLTDIVEYVLTPQVILKDIAYVSASATESNLFAAIKTDGNLIIWGGNYKEPKILDKNVSMVSVGKDYLLYIKDDATVWGFGVNNYGQLGIGTFDVPQLPVKVMDNAKEIRTACESSFALKKNGSVWSWGRNKNNILGQQDNFSEISSAPKQILEGMAMSTLQRLVCNKKQIEVNAGSQGVIPVFPYPLTADYKEITWSSSNPECVVVEDNGIIYAKKAGTSNITATIIDNANRIFSIRCLVKATATTDINDISEENTINIWSHNSNIYVQGVPKGQKIIVAMTDGTIIYKGVSNESLNVIPINSNGMYIVIAGGKSVKLYGNNTYYSKYD